MRTINNKKFNKLLKKTIKDFEYSGHPISAQLKKLLNKDIKDLTIIEITPLVEILVSSERLSENDLSSFLGGEYLEVQKQILKEHKEMLNYIKQFFNIEILHNNFLNITKKDF